jgi:hypothetical protein
MSGFSFAGRTGGSKGGMNQVRVEGTLPAASMECRQAGRSARSTQTKVSLLSLLTYSTISKTAAFIALRRTKIDSFFETLNLLFRIEI